MREPAASFRFVFRDHARDSRTPKIVEMTGQVVEHGAAQSVRFPHGSDRQRLMAQEPLLPDGSVARHPDRALASLAYINVTWEHGRRSYLDNFVPFVLEVLREAPATLTAEGVAAQVQNRFGLDFPTNVVRSLIARAVRTRQVRRLPRSQEVELAPDVVDRLPDISSQQRECARRQNRLVRSLVDFTRARFDLDWDEPKAQKALFEFVEAHVLPLLQSTVGGGPVTGLGSPAQGQGYVVATFIADTIESDPTGFEYLDEMIKGSMLAAALYVDTSGHVVERKFKRTTLYLDTSVCLRVLGHEGPEAQQAAQSLVHIALDQKAEVACFEHTVSELRGVLAAAGDTLRRSPGSEAGTRGVVAHYRSSGLTAAEIEMALATLDRDLRANRIEVRPSPHYSHALGVDEDALEAVLQEQVRYFNQRALIHDLKSLTAIHRLRGGRSAPHVEECRAVFITNNTSLVRASRSFFDSGEHEWPLAMDDAGLATLLWVKAPTVSPNLPKQQIVADCFAAMSPSPNLWSKVSEEVERLGRAASVDEEGIAFLRYSHEAERAIMDVTLGDPQRVSERTVQEALAKARKEAAEPAERARDAALARAEELERIEAQSRFDAETRKAESEGLTKRLDDVEQRLSRSEAQIRKQVTKHYRWGALAAKVAAGLIIACSIVVGVVSLFPSSRDLLPGPTWVWLSSASTVALVASGVTLMWGKSAVEWINDARDRAIARRLSELEQEAG
ncbi:hypothetical protein [Nocardioides bizhenqiangii]|uniref:Uncharacterized protein n=1 Tax=Nocardioides bizhenqiangii TaxID=3095076 RepID=A0ABZ0ZSP0_9ACTN|nr:hypothetical protein [Nocardioides sp. HM61]WQQ26819.1 hypothetical protein SHK19_00970 [Nocardioides sp. HM61]